MGSGICIIILLRGDKILSNFTIFVKKKNNDKDNDIKLFM